MKKTDMWLSGWPQKLKYFKVSPGYKLLWVCCKFRTRSGSEAGCSGDADIFLGRMAKFLVRSVALNLGFLQETSNKSAVEQILQWCGSYSWKFTSTAPFHALGLGDCMSVSRLLGSGHDKCIFLAWSGKKKPKPPSPPPPPSMQRRQGWQCVRMAAGKKATITGYYLNRVKIKKWLTTQSVSRIPAVFSRLANYSVCINFGLFLLSFVFLFLF